MYVYYNFGVYKPFACIKLNLERLHHCWGKSEPGRAHRRKGNPDHRVSGPGLNGVWTGLAPSPPFAYFTSRADGDNRRTKALFRSEGQPSASFVNIVFMRSTWWQALGLLSAVLTAVLRQPRMPCRVVQ
ncbi:hypothetical protein RRG08_049438 [Elysia crispata]|uniref:Uncharacterized protein n=1 Tax=Elysia crispata TaxID=231223 RepID=A0AAE0ZSE0_9GAST|nr:hypothetical protein RRG08_049438 [Elysia crispata]